jgi:hypothetical protein
MIDLSRGACAGKADASYGIADPFHPEPVKGRPTNHDPYQEAKEICARCSIRDLCLQDALTEPVQWGFRAGMTPEQRMDLARNTTHQPGKLSDHDLVMRLAMVENGWTDTRIAAAQGVTASAIRSWRLANGHRLSDRRMHTQDMQALKVKLWEAGYTDKYIAEQLGCRTDVIRKWRQKTGRKVNPVRRKVPA